MHADISEHVQPEHQSGRIGSFQQRKNIFPVQQAIDDYKEGTYSFFRARANDEQASCSAASLSWNTSHVRKIKPMNQAV